MGRGLGHRQRGILKALEIEDGLFVSDFMRGSSDAERRLVLNAIRGLQDRGLVHTKRETNRTRVTPVGTKKITLYDPDGNVTGHRVGPRFLRRVSESSVWLT